MLSHDMKMSKVILLNFGAFVPGRGVDRQAKTVQPMTRGCQGFQCKGECIGAADEYWAQTVGSALIRLTVQGKLIENSFLQGQRNWVFIFAPYSPERKYLYPYYMSPIEIGLL